MAYKTLEHTDMNLFKNRLWKLMEKKEIYTAKDLAKELYDRDYVSVRQKESNDEPSTIYGRAVGSIEKKIQKHLNSNDTKKLQGEFVIAYCKFFECSADYLFGNINCETHDKQFIHDKTGLSTEAIEQLIKWNEEIKLPNCNSYRNSCRNSILFISDLLECCGIQATALADNVYNYLFWKKISETKNLTSKIAKDKYGKYEVARVRTSYKFMDCLEYIYAHSKNILTKEELQKRYPRTEEEKYWDDILGV